MLRTETIVMGVMHGGIPFPSCCGCGLFRTPVDFPSNPVMCDLDFGLESPLSLIPTRRQFFALDFARRSKTERLHDK